MSVKKPDGTNADWYFKVLSRCTVKNRSLIIIYKNQNQLKKKEGINNKRGNVNILGC
jgi:hypothetical protein